MITTRPVCVAAHKLVLSHSFNGVICRRGHATLHSTVLDIFSPAGSCHRSAAVVHLWCQFLLELLSLNILLGWDSEIDGSSVFTFYRRLPVIFSGYSLNAVGAEEVSLPPQLQHLLCVDILMKAIFFTLAE